MNWPKDTEECYINDMLNEIIKMIELSKNTKGQDWKHNIKQIKIKINEYAKEYHESEVKKLNIPAVSNSLPVDYLQTEMIKAIKELAKESTAPDKVTPDWMENDIKRGMQWMHKRLTGNDC